MSTKAPIQNGRQRAPKWPTGSGNGSNPFPLRGGGSATADFPLRKKKTKKKHGLKTLDFA